MTQLQDFNEEPKLFTLQTHGSKENRYDLKELVLF